MEINLTDLPENVNIQTKIDYDKGIYGFCASFDFSDMEVGIILDINKLKPLSPFWLIKQKEKAQMIDKKYMKIFLETLISYLEEGKNNFPNFSFFSKKDKLTIAPNMVDPLNILGKKI